MKWKMRQLPLEKIVRDTVYKHRLILPGETLVAAVSGGPDSVAMLHMVQRITSGWDVKFHVAHLNHMFRGEQSDEEARFVEKMARSWGLSCTVEKYNIPAYVKKTGYSPEEAARKIRYDFLRRAAADTGASGILTAHHGDDQAETVLMHLLRGAGPEGLAAISPKEGDLRRPLLYVSKEDILDYCRMMGLEFRIDPTNSETFFLRNRIRLKLIPMLKEFNPRVMEALAKTADICRAENEALGELTRQFLQDAGYMTNENETAVNLRRLKSLPVALQRRTVRDIYDHLTEKQGGLSFEQTEEVLGLGTGKEISLPSGVYVRRNYEELFFSFSPGESITAVQDSEPFLLPVPGRVEIPKLNIYVETVIRPTPPGEPFLSESHAVLNTEILREPLKIRTRRSGDRFQPEGMEGSKKLKDYFIDEKVPRKMRDCIPLLLSGNSIIWVVGRRLAEGTRAAKNSPQAVVVTVKKLSGA